MSPESWKLPHQYRVVWHSTMSLQEQPGSGLTCRTLRHRPTLFGAYLPVVGSLIAGASIDCFGPWFGRSSSCRSPWFEICIEYILLPFKMSQGHHLENHCHHHTYTRYPQVHENQRVKYSLTLLVLSWLSTSHKYAAKKLAFTHVYI
jgi:hypothetical protein